MSKFRQSAFPKMEVRQTKNSYGDVTGYVCESTGGFTKREFCALTLMQALISNADRHSQVRALISNVDRHSQEGDCLVWDYKRLSKIAINAADELLTQLNGEGA